MLSKEGGVEEKKKEGKKKKRVWPEGWKIHGLKKKPCNFSVCLIFCLLCLLRFLRFLCFLCFLPWFLWFLCLVVMTQRLRFLVFDDLPVCSVYPVYLKYYPEASAYLA